MFNYNINVCMSDHIAGEKLFDRFPPNSQQTFKIGHYKLTQTPAFNGQNG